MNKWISDLNVQNLTQGLEGESRGSFLFRTFAMNLYQRAATGQEPPVLECHKFKHGARHPDFEQEIHKLAESAGLTLVSVWGETPEQALVLEGAPLSDSDHTDLYLGCCTALLVHNKASHFGFEAVMLDKAFLDKLTELKNRLFNEYEETVVYLLVLSGGQLSIRPLPVPFKALERGNYTKVVLADYDRIKQALQTDTPLGRLVILDGKQGTGKSYLIRGLIHDIPPKDCIFLFIPANMVQTLTGPELATLLTDIMTSEKKKIVLIIEDADEALVQRDGTNEGKVSTLLNLTDGIIGELLDVRVICTTNRKIEDIDQAIKRRGRLVCHSHLTGLDRVQAQEIYERVSGKKAPEENWETATSLADIYARALDPNWAPEGSKQTLGFKR